MFISMPLQYLCFYLLFKRTQNLGSLTATPGEGITFSQADTGAQTILGVNDITGLTFVQTISTNSLEVKLKVGSPVLFEGFRGEV